MRSSNYEKYDQVWVGILAGFALPLFWYFILMSLFDSMETMGWLEPGRVALDFRQRTSALVGVCLNILPLQIFNNQNMERAMRGVIFPTVIWVAVWLYLFGASVL
ncbi:MAG: hypothetical protein IPL46_00355 [Saprospiraceae bacterium]|nr:hypothetical protein [Saprospiraceae bacterium]